MSLVVIIAGGSMEHGEISQLHLKWFKTRGISEKTLTATGVYSGQHHQNGDSWNVQRSPNNGNIIVFSYLQNNEEVNAKYRAANKKFYQKPGGVKTFWNADVLSEPCLKDGSVSLVITEGEMDALAVIESGYPYAISVPDGAPPPRTDDGSGCDDSNIIPEHDGKYGFVYNTWENLKPVRKIIIATDDDEPGKRLAEELVRRLGRVRCQFIHYPEGCKDLNEVLLAHGPEAVIRTLTDAKPYPVSGVYTFAELPPEPDLCPLVTGWGRLDDFIKPYFPAFMVVTGIAGSGKSTWVNQLVAQMSIIHSIGIAIASFEMRIKPFISDSLLNTYKDLRGKIGGDIWLENNFVFIAPEPDKDNDQFDVDWLIERATAAVIRYGIRILVIDPWNEIEHAHRKFESQTEYIGRSIKALKRFGRQFEVLVILVAHPSKSGAEKAKVYHKGAGADQKPTNEISLYDISDSAHFSNKADFGVVISRIEGSNLTDVIVKKVRYQTVTGQPGTVSLVYDHLTRTFGQ